MGRPQPHGGVGKSGGTPHWGGAKVTKHDSSGFPKSGGNDYDAQRGCNERKDYSYRGTVRQAAGPLKGEGSVNP